MAIEANVGARVGDYILVRKIGEGGMAEVWLARHSGTAELRALKFLNSQFQGIPEVEARFQNEGESKLIHPNIVRIFEVGQQGGSSFIAMEYVDGHDLENILNSRRGPLTIAESLDIGTQILAGLGFAHSNGIIHRDIKPSNVLVDQEGHAYVMDFGIAKVLRAGRALTQVNSRLGTPDYMSPEQIKNPRDVDTRSDIYSFGCLFCELLTGWPPFDRGEGYETEHDIKTAHVTLPPTPPIQRKPGLPEQLNAITLRCLAKAKEDRPQTCDEVIAAFNDYRLSTMKKQPSRSSTAVEPPPPPMPRPPLGTPTPYGGRPTPNPAPPFTPSSTPTPNPALRRGAEFTPPHTTGPGVAGRTPTVVESGHPSGLPFNYPANQGTNQPGSRPSQPGLPPGFQPPAQPSYQHQVLPQGPPQNQGPGLPPAFASNPGVNPQFATPIRFGPVVKADNGTFALMFAIAAISLFALIALGGSGWTMYQKAHADDLAETTPAGTDTQPATDASQTTNQQVAAPQTNTAQPPANQTVTNEPQTPAQNDQTPSGMTPEARQKIIQQEMQYENPPVKPRTQPAAIKPIPLPSAATSGTLVWTGDASTQSRQVVTIIRSNGSVLGGGRLTGTMFPAAPVQVTLYPSNGTIVVPPDPKTNYNSLQLYLTNPGAQTIYIHWSVKTN